jgi:hypothetical protein
MQNEYTKTRIVQDPKDILHQTIFETVWIQSEFDKQTKVMEAYSKMFKGLRVREESFRPDKFFEG